MQRRDLVVIGCSAGGVEALPRILQQLPRELDAAIFIVQHMAATSKPQLVAILGRGAQLPVVWAEQGAPVERGRVVVAPPDAHLVFVDGHIGLSGGAREHHARPSIDKLFRSAAAHHGSRVIGVLLTGMLDDGVAGLKAIRAAGGMVLVQDPADAAFPELPRRALLALEPDQTLALDAIGAALIALVGTPVAPVTPPADLVLEARMDEQGQGTPQAMHELGPQTALSCPDCCGPMWQLGDEQHRRYRCYLGHVSSAHEVLAASAAEVEQALWSAVRALGERATTLETLATDAARIGNGQSAEGYAVRAREARAQVEVARRFMLELARAR